ASQMTASLGQPDITSRLDCHRDLSVNGSVYVDVAVVTAKRDKAAALKFLKRIMKKYGRPLSVVTDGLCSYPASMTEIGNPIAGRPVVGSTIAPRIRISRFDDENGPQAFVRQLREGPSGSIALSARG